MKILRGKWKEMKWLRRNKLIKGDMVYHVLYGKAFRAIVMESGPPQEALADKEQTLIHMVPGTEYENYFDKQPKQRRISRYSGWVSTHWLIKVC